MSKMETRRDFLKKSGMVLGGAAVFGTTLLSGCAKEEPAETTAAPVPETVEVIKEVEKEAPVPTHPYEYKELDPEAVKEAAYKAYFENGCCYGAAQGLLVNLQEKVGYPYTHMTAMMFANGGGGYTTGSLCGALGGSAAVIGMVCEPGDARAIMKDLIKWYTTTALPNYRPETPIDIQTTSPSANCADSVGGYLAAAGVENGSQEQKWRCGGLTGDVASKAAELLNIHFGFAEAPAVEETAAEATLADNEYIGEADGFGGKIKVKVTMDGDKIAKIDVLSHSETAGVSDPAFKTIPDAIIKAQSTSVDAASGATFSSKGIMAAVEDALSKVAK